MEGPDGLATAQRIRQTDESVILVFVTNLAQYAIRQIFPAFFHGRPGRRISPSYFTKEH